MAQKQKSRKSNRVSNHAFKGVRDVVLSGATGGLSNNPLIINTNSSGNSSGSVVFAPLGLSAAVLASGVYTNGPTGNVSAPMLRGLGTKAVGFQWYRVTRAKLCFVGSIGSTATGVITLAGYADMADIGFNTTAANVAGPNTKTFDLASSSSRELTVPIPVDTAWKKVSSVLTVAGNAAGVYGTNTCVIPINSVGDLSFGCISFFVAGAAVSQPNIGSLYIDYDVEFKNPIDGSINF